APDEAGGGTGSVVGPRRGGGGRSDGWRGDRTRRRRRRGSADRRRHGRHHFGRSRAAPGRVLLVAGRLLRARPGWLGPRRTPLLLLTIPLLPAARHLCHSRPAGFYRVRGNA